VGYPWKVVIEDDKENMWRLFSLWQKMDYCIFTTVYSIKERKWVVVDKIYMDFDDEDAPEHALTDVRKLIRWARSENYQVEGVYTGGKGYHGYIILAPTFYNVNDYEDEYKLKCKLRAVANWISAQGWLWRYNGDGSPDREYGEKHVKPLRTADDQVKGDYRRFTRVPGYRYVKYKQQQYIPKDTYCQVVPNDILLSESHGRIAERCSVYNSYKPTIREGVRLPTLEEFLEENKIRVEDWLGYYGSHGAAQFTEYEGQYTHPNAEIVKGIFPKPCIHQDLLGSEEPRHITRFYVAVMLLNFYQWHPKEVIEFFRNLNLSDFSEEETTVQVYHIASRMPPYLRPSCSRIKQFGLCVGSSCEDYRKTYEG